MQKSAALAPALFASAFHPHVGGVEELVRQLALEQRRRGMSPVVVTNHYPKTLAAAEVVDGIPVRRFSFRVPERTTRQLAGWALASAATQRWISAELRRSGTDVVHVQCVSSNGRYALAAAKRLQLPLVVTMQGELSMDATGVYERSPQLRASWRRLIEAADVITGCSGYVLEEAERIFGRPLGDRAMVVYNGVRLEDFGTRRPSREPFVLGIGRMVTQKGFDLLIEACQALPDGIRLVLAGDGPERAALERQAARSRAHVEFVGRVEHKRAVELFSSASAFVLPSRHEPQGIVVLEAMAGGAAVVAADVGGVPEIVRHGENGLLFKGGDAAHLRTALLSVLADEATRSALVQRASATAADFSWRAIADQYSGCYDQAMGRR